MTTVSKKLYIVAQSRDTQLTVAMEFFHVGDNISITEVNAVEDALLCELSSVLDTYGYTVGVKGVSRFTQNEIKVIGLNGE